MTAIELESIQADICDYFGERKSLVSPVFTAVVVDVIDMVSRILRDGFEKSLTELPAFAGDSPHTRSSKSPRL